LRSFRDIQHVEWCVYCQRRRHRYGDGGAVHYDDALCGERAEDYQPCAKGVSKLSLLTNFLASFSIQCQTGSGQPIGVNEGCVAGYFDTNAIAGSSQAWGFNVNVAQQANFFSNGGNSRTYRGVQGVNAIAPALKVSGTNRKISKLGPRSLKGCECSRLLEPFPCSGPGAWCEGMHILGIGPAAVRRTDY
jgi:hypothetical protein